LHPQSLTKDISPQLISALHVTHVQHSSTLVTKHKEMQLCQISPHYVVDMAHCK